MTSELTGRFVTGAVAATREASGDGPLLRYACELEVPRLLRAEVAVLKAVALRYVMADPARRAIQQREQEMLTELVLITADRGADALDPLFAHHYSHGTGRRGAVTGGVGPGVPADRCAGGGTAPSTSRVGRRSTGVHTRLLPSLPRT